MRLLRLIADFNLVQDRLAQSLVRDVTLETRVALTRRLAALMDSIERHDPESTDQLRTKVEFFLHRARRSRSKRDLAIAMDLIARCGNELLSDGPCQSRSTQPHEVLDRLMRRGVTLAQAAPRIIEQPSRVSLLDRDFRHRCTSRGNLEFHCCSRSRFDNLHMADLIGAERYLGRSRWHMQSAMSGRSSTYYYTLDVPCLGARVMQCTMRPWHLPSGEVSGLLVWVSDVTDRLTRHHGFDDVPAAFPDHNIDGTT